MLDLFLWLGIAVAVIVVIVHFSPSPAGLTEGIEAYKEGNYARALAILSPLAEDGDAEAQIYLGRMHYKGKGTTEDYALAYMWTNLAAASGNKEHIKEREWLTKCLHPAQVAEGQRLGRRWLAKKEREKNAK